MVCLETSTRRLAAFHTKKLTADEGYLINSGPPLSLETWEEPSSDAGNLLLNKV